MPRPKTTSDERVLEITRTVLMERGPAAPISAIAKRARLGGPAILARFGSRADLIRAALAPPSLAPLIVLLQREPDPGAFPAQLNRTIHALADWYAIAQPRRLLLRMSAPSQRPRPAAEHSDGPRLEPTLTIWLARAQARGLVRSGDPRALAATVLAALAGAATAPLTDQARPENSSTIIDQLTTLLRP